MKLQCAAIALLSLVTMPSARTEGTAIVNHIKVPRSRMRMFEKSHQRSADLYPETACLAMYETSGARPFATTAA